MTLAWSNIPIHSETSYQVVLYWICFPKNVTYTWLERLYWKRGIPWTQRDTMTAWYGPLTCTYTIPISPTSMRWPLRQTFFDYLPLIRTFQGFVIYIINCFGGFLAGGGAGSLYYITAVKLDFQHIISEGLWTGVVKKRNNKWVNCSELITLWKTTFSIFLKNLVMNRF